MAIADEIEALVIRSPGLTEAEIAAALFGEAGYPQQVSTACRSLRKNLRIERRGRSDPFRYFPKGALPAPSAGVKRRGYSVIRRSAFMEPDKGAFERIRKI
jgi:hypothetical protein